MSSGAIAAVTGANSTPSIVWPPPPREPLPAPPTVTANQPGPPEASCWTDGPFDEDVPFTPPGRPDITFHRGNFCGVRVPGFTEGGNDKDPSLVITWDCSRYSPDGLDSVVRYYATVCGYTHLVLSIPQCRNQGRTLDDLVRAARACKLYGLFVILNVMGGDGPWPDEWAAAQPWLDALTSQNLVDILCVAWQIDKWYQADLVDVTLAVVTYAQAHDLPVSQHWLNDACALWPYPQYGIDNRFDYARFMADKVQYQYMQVDVDAALPAVQNGAYKILQSYAGLPTRLVGAELDAQAEYDNPLQRLERWGDQKGYYTTCARGFGRVMDGGYLNGARRPDGSAL